mmetsp:Transcript_4806/g.10222  ORF Transcript_4806/g.10222 Transcript_4806/m.10222 type:complete len:396 (-) Transcript_4806:372-1559(-)
MERFFHGAAAAPRIPVKQLSHSSLNFSMTSSATGADSHSEATSSHLQQQQQQQQLQQMHAQRQMPPPQLSPAPQLQPMADGTMQRPRRTDDRLSSPLPTSNTRRGGKKPHAKNSPLKNPKAPVTDAAPRKPPKRSISGSSRPSRPVAPERTHSGFMSIGSEEKSAPDAAAAANHGELTLEEYRQQLEEYIATNGVVGGSAENDLTDEKMRDPNDGNSDVDDDDDDSSADSDLEDDWEQEKVKRQAKQDQKKKHSKKSKKNKKSNGSGSSGKRKASGTGVDRTKSGLSLMSMDNKSETGVSIFSNLSDISPPAEPPKTAAAAAKLSRGGVGRTLSGVSYMSELTELSQTMDELVLRPLKDEELTTGAAAVARTTGSGGSKRSEGDGKKASGKKDIV